MLSLEKCGCRCGVGSFFGFCDDRVNWPLLKYSMFARVENKMFTEVWAESIDGQRLEWNTIRKYFYPYSSYYSIYSLKGNRSKRALCEFIRRRVVADYVARVYIEDRLEKMGPSTVYLAVGEERCVD